MIKILFIKIGNQKLVGYIGKIMKIHTKNDKKYRKCILVPDVSEIPYPQVFNIG
jgi:hypothetical protein